MRSLDPLTDDLLGVCQSLAVRLAIGHAAGSKVRTLTELDAEIIELLTFKAGSGGRSRTRSPKSMEEVELHD